MWRALVFETVTGLIVSDVVLSDRPQFKRALCDKGTWGVELNIGATANRGIDFRAYVENSPKYSWAVAFDSYICQAGPSTSYGFEEQTRKLTVSGVGIGGLFGRRVIRNPLSASADIAKASADLVLNDLTLRGIALGLVDAAMLRSGYALPINVPSDAETGTLDRTYYGYDMRYTWDALADIAEEENGPEFDFAPRFTSDMSHIEWDFLVGTPLLGDQSSIAVWDYGGALSTIDEDGNTSAAYPWVTWAKGSGNERELKFGHAATSRPAGFPGVDFVDTTHVSSEDTTALNGYASEAVDEFTGPTKTWACSVRIDGLSGQTGVDVSPRLGEWSLGDAPQFGVSGHPWIPDGMYRRRIIGFSNKSHAEVALEIGETPLVI